MPKRMLRDWTDSLRLDGISADAERLFTRLIMKADDYGRFHGDSRLIRAACFPLIDNLRTHELDRWLDELSTRELILRYEADGRSCIAIVNFGQRLRASQTMFPPMAGKGDDWLPTSDDFRQVAAECGEVPQVAAECGEVPQVAAECGEVRPEEKRREEEEKVKKKVKREESPPPLDFRKSKPERCNPNRMATFEQVLKFGQSQPMPITEECCEAFFDRMEGEGWITPNGHPLADWRARFRSWATNWANNAAGKGAKR